MNRILSPYDVRRIYGELPVVACAGVSLVVERGEFVAVVGPSGSGEPTLLNLIGILDRPTSDAVEIDGINVSRLSGRKLPALRACPIGFVFQQFHLSEGMNAIDNVANGFSYLGVSRAERRQEAEVVLIRVGLSHRLCHRSYQMSGDERQYVVIARTVVDDPPLLLADESAGNLGSVSGTSIVELLHELHEQGTTIVVITRGNDLALQLPRQITVRDGHIVHGSAVKEVAHV